MFFDREGVKTWSCEAGIKVRTIDLNETSRMVCELLELEGILISRKCAEGYEQSNDWTPVWLVGLFVLLCCVVLCMNSLRCDRPKHTSDRRSVFSVCFYFVGQFIFMSIRSRMSMNRFLFYYYFFRLAELMAFRMSSRRLHVAS
jgi:hypothetical protein